MNLPENIENYFKKIISTSQNISSIWLFGSRVNGGTHVDSDWDILIFADEIFFNNLKENGPKPPKNVSLMVLYNGDNFKSPWRREKDGKYEKGSLTGWKWTYHTSKEANYEGVKELPNGHLRTRQEKAVRIF
ncbi:MAG: nucleotidyltransferase domain-containing protein [Deltaproteobacteria bacterium]|nr:nucleotidyltransferase domain-containing protein [Deltaproteobacteria bacterium]